MRSRSTSATVRPTSAREACSAASAAWATGGAPLLIETHAVRGEDRLRSDLGAGRHEHGAMHGVFQFADGDRDIDHEQIGAAPGAQHGKRLRDIRGMGDGRAAVHRELGRGGELASERADDQEAHGLAPFLPSPACGRGPTRATVTARIAAMPGAPSVSRNSSTP
jgi:hypothetical protein